MKIYTPGWGNVEGVVLHPLRVAGRLSPWESGVVEGCAHWAGRRLRLLLIGQLRNVGRVKGWG